MDTKEARFSGVQVLHKTVDVLEALRGAHQGLPLADLAARLKLPKPTVYRILATLESRGYIDRVDGGAYRLARKLFELLQGDVTSEQALVKVARPVMQDLLSNCKETVNLGVLDGGEVVVIETMESPQTVRMASKIGNRRYAHSTALGKVLLAGMADKDVRRLLRAKGMPRFTNYTFTAETAFLSHLNQVCQQGYAFDNRENESDGRCVAAPILGAGKQVIAALSISGPLPRMTMARARSFIKDLCRACRTISEALIRPMNGVM